MLSFHLKYHNGLWPSIASQCLTTKHVQTGLARFGLPLNSKWISGKKSPINHHHHQFGRESQSCSVSHDQTLSSWDEMRQLSLNGYEFISRTTTQMRIGTAPQLIFLGPPGVGKGTFASLLSSSWSIPQVSTGNVIRAEIAKKSEQGKLLKELAERGELVADDLVIAIVENRLDEPDTQRGFILDGFPRTVYQAQALDTFSGPLLAVNLTQSRKILTAKLAGRRVCNKCQNTYNVTELIEGDYVFKPLLPSAEQLEACEGCRHLQQRADDSEEIVARRLDIYDKATQPLIDYYDKRGMLETFHVRRGVEDWKTFEDMVKRAGRQRALF